MAEDAYQKAYEREKAKNAQIEQLLEDNTRRLYLASQTSEADNERLRTQQRQMRLLLEISQTDTQDFSLSSVLQNILCGILELLEWPIGHVLQRNQTDQTILSSGLWQIEQDNDLHDFIEISNNISYAENTGVIGNLVKNPQLAWFEHIDKDTTFKRSSSASKAGLKTALFIPITQNGQLIAIIECYTPFAISQNAAMTQTIESVIAQLDTILDKRATQLALAEKIEELETTQAQLIQSSKLASIGQLAAGIAHEINNPIGFIASNLGTLQEYLDALLQVNHLAKTLLEKQSLSDFIRDWKALDEDEDLDFIENDARTLLQESADGLKRVKDIVLDLKVFSHQDNDGEAFSLHDIHECINTSLKVGQNELKYHCTIHTDFSECPPILCNASKLNQVILNMLVNAAHAIGEDDGDITISTTFNEQASSVTIQIQDTGPGIPPEVLEKIFDPFFTTKPVGVGTGLGLSISYAIIQEHGGSLTCDSTPGKGTCFTIELPTDPNQEDKHV